MIRNAMSLLARDLRFGQLDEDERRELCKSYVTSARRELAIRLRRGRVDEPIELLRQLADDMDQLITALFFEAVPAQARAALVALGGYGRRELYPYSDVDLLILIGQGEELKSDELVARTLYPLWDAELSVGHAVRTVDETLELAAEDLTLCTSLLDARMLGGDEGLFFALQAGAHREFFANDRVNGFVGALVEERERRHKRFGETVFLLEPDIKGGQGGLRDVNTALWAAKARFGIKDLDELSSVAGATERQESALLDARRLLRRLRLEMHLEAGRAQDRLLFAIQESLATKLFPQEEIPGIRDRVSAVTPAVERLMHAYYRAARDVVLETEGVLQRCCVPEGGDPPGKRQIDDHFCAVGSDLLSEDPERFWDQPAQMLRAFELAHTHDLRIGRSLQDALAEAAAAGPGAQLLADGRAADLWRRLLVARERPGHRTLIERMHDLGLLNALIPEFEPCTGRVQHDLYHVYTVDQHSLYVVGLLKSLRREPVRPEPLFGLARELIGELEEVESLFLAALLHDVAKPLGSGHAEKGARIAAGVAARLGLEIAQQREVVFLVRQHLTMPHLSQRRDLSDPQVVGSFADLVGNVDRLKRLYLLSIADTAMTGPGNLTEWKATLMNELLQRTRDWLDREDPHAETVAGPSVETRRRELVDLLAGRWGERAERLVRRLPDDLFSALSLQRLQHHISTALLREAEGARVRVGARRLNGSTAVVTVCCEDAPGLLASITGVMLLQNTAVHAAQVYTLPGEDGGADQVLDIFWVAAPAESAEDDEERFERLETTLDGVLTKEIDLSREIADRIRPSRVLKRILPRVETQVAVDNEASERSTVVEIRAADKQGLLHGITRTLNELDLQIDLSKVATEAGQAVDSFYIRDRTSGAKIRDAERLQAIRNAIARAVDALDAD